MANAKGLGIRLLNLIREKKTKEAFEKLQQKDPAPDLKARDQAGWHAIHFAALHGFVDLVEKLIELGAEVNAWDNNGQTPLHKAARAGNTETVVALIAHGAHIFTLDWQEHQPLELAVKERHLEVIDILFLCGCDLLLRDWTWAVAENPDKITKNMKEMFKRQSMLNAGYKYGGIYWCLKHISKDSGPDLAMEELNLTFINERTEQPLYMYCGRMQSEYSDLKRYLDENQEFFSDMYVCRLWQVKDYTREFKFTIKIRSRPGLNDVVVFKSCGGCTGKVISTDSVNKQPDNESNLAGNDDEVEEKDEVTYVTVSVLLKPQGIALFAVVLQEKEAETFTISKAAVTIQPEAEPDAEIDIPEGAFESGGELSVQFLETKDVNEDEVEGPILTTNVLDMSMSDRQQPQEGKGVKMKLPIYVEEKEEEMVVVCTSDENPETEDDWDVIEAKMNRTKRGAALCFTANHFSIYAGAGVEKVKKSKAEVIDAVQRAICKERKVHIVVLMKLQNEEEAKYSMAVQCATPKKVEKRIKEHKKDGYQMRAKSEEIIVQDNQTFRLTFEGNIKLIAIDNIRLDYQSKRPKNSQICEFTVHVREEPGTGKISIEKEIEEAQPCIEEVVYEGGWCFKAKIRKRKQDPIIKYEKASEINVEFEVPRKKSEIPEHVPEIPDDEFDQEEIKHWKDDSMIKVLRYTSLHQLAGYLSLEEIQHVAHQLRMKQDTIDAIMEHERDDFKKIFEILVRWRGRRPHAIQIDQLCNALRSCQREDLAEKVNNATVYDTYL